MQYLSPFTATDSYSLSKKLTGNISDNLSLIFSVFLASEPEWPSMYFIVKSCIHTVRPPELDQNMPCLSLYHRPVPNSAKFWENVEILRKQANSTARLKILCFTENCGPYWSATLGIRKGNFWSHWKKTVKCMTMSPAGWFPVHCGHLQPQCSCWVWD